MLTFFFVEVSLTVLTTEQFAFRVWCGGQGTRCYCIVRVHTYVRVCLAGSGRCYLGCTVGGAVVYMGRDREGGGKQRRAYGVVFVVSCLEKLAW